MPAGIWIFAACLALSPDSDHITAGDLARAIPEFTVADPAGVAGWAPAPGVRRIFSNAELRRIAARLGIPLTSTADACFERKVTPPQRSRVLAALQAQVSDGPVELLDFGRAPLPEGELVFPPGALRRTPDAFLWSGYVRYAPGRKYATWAKVRLPPARVVVAAVDLAPGRALDGGQLVQQQRDAAPGSGLIASPEEAIGKWPRRLIRAGSAIAARWLQPAPEVVRGDAVTVEVRSGGVHLEFDARAETSAERGARVTVRNPLSHARFVAQVESKGRVSAGPASRPGKEKP